MTSYTSLNGFTYSELMLPSSPASALTSSVRGLHPRLCELARRKSSNPGTRYNAPPPSKRPVLGRGRAQHPCQTSQGKRFVSANVYAGQNWLRLDYETVGVVAIPRFALARSEALQAGLQ